MQSVIGIDEVGRGCLAGPLCMAAVFLLEAIDGLSDSKALTPRRRQLLAAEIRRHAIVGLGWVDASSIDTIGLSAALRLAAERAIAELPQHITGAHPVIIDGTINFLSAHQDITVHTMIKADAKVPAVMAASIIAKVARDTFMQSMDAVYPEYGFASHVGYGTKQHFAALRTHGATVLHRRSFKGVL